MFDLSRACYLFDAAFWDTCRSKIGAEHPELSSTMRHVLGATSFFAPKPGGGAMVSQSIAAGNSWSQVKLAGITVSGGDVELGVTGGGQTVSLDDFTLVAE